MSDLLVVENLQQVFGGSSRTYAVDGVSFRMPEEATILNLVGESGSGKSTIARILLGLLQPTAGRILYKGNDIFSRDRKWNRQFRGEVQAVFPGSLTASITRSIQGGACLEAGHPQIWAGQ